MAALLFFALLVALLFGLSFAVEILFWGAILGAGLWILGFIVRGAERTWYRW